jgi:predicted transcriptional regulator
MSIESKNNSENKDKEEQYDESNTTEHNGAGRQAFVNIEQLLFELASAERLSILSRLSEQKVANNLSTLSKDLNIVVQEIHRHINRLLEAGLIQKTSANSYSLTAFGIVMLTQIPTLKFLAKNKDYFSDHILGQLPLKFIQRLGALSDSQYLDNQVAVFEYQREILSKAQNYLYIIIPLIPLYLIDSIMLRLEANETNSGRNVPEMQLKYLLPYNAILPKKRHNDLRHSAFYELLNKEIVQRRMTERVHVGIIINESQSMVMFPTIAKKGSTRVRGGEEGQEEIDMNSGFYSTDSIFHEWCVDYFNYMWHIAKPFNRNKLNEV